MRNKFLQVFVVYLIKMQNEDSMTANIFNSLYSSNENYKIVN